MKTHGFPVRSSRRNALPSDARLVHLGGRVDAGLRRARRLGGLGQGWFLGRQSYGSPI